MSYLDRAKEKDDLTGYTDFEITKALHAKFKAETGQETPFKEFAGEIGLPLVTTPLEIPPEGGTGLEQPKQEPIKPTIAPIIDPVQQQPSAPIQPQQVIQSAPPSAWGENRGDLPPQLPPIYGTDLPPPLPPPNEGPPPPIDNGIGRPQTAAGAFIKGAGHVAASTIKSAAMVAQNQRARILGDFDLIDAGEVPTTPTPEVMFYSRHPEQRNSLREVYQDIGGEDPRESSVYKAGDAIDNWLSENIKTNPRFEQEFFTGKVAGGLGSMSAFVVANLIGRGALRTTGMGPGAAGAASTATAGAAVQASDTFEDAINNGADLQTAFDAAKLGALVGTSEAVPIVAILNRLDKSTGGSVRHVISNLLKEGSEEALQEAFQSVAGNMIAKEMYDPDRKMWTGAGEGAGVGFTTGALISFLASMIGLKSRGKSGRQPEAKAVEDVSQDEQLLQPEALPEDPAAQQKEGPTEDEIQADRRAGTVADLEEFMADDRSAEEIIAERRAKEKTKEADAKANEQAQQEAEAAALAQEAADAGRAKQFQQEFDLAEEQRQQQARDAEYAQAAQLEQGQRDEALDYRIAQDQAAEEQPTAMQLAMEKAKGTGKQESPIKVETATDVGQAAAQADIAPSDAQKAEGNYQKGHIKMHGLDISIENAKGSTRSGKDADGEIWATVMPANYGYIKRTEGADGDNVDVYIGDNPESKTVFMVDQIDPKTGKFDEAKVIFGTTTQAEAEALYDAGFSDGSGASRRGAVTAMGVAQFKRWLKKGNTKKAFRYEAPKVDKPRGKVDKPPESTISRAPKKPSDRRGKPRKETIERRVDTGYRKKVAQMSMDERAKALLTSDKAPLSNERAYQENDRKKHQSFMDLDNFKELNTEYSYEGADQLIGAAGEIMKSEAAKHGILAYHLHGDEFIHESDDPKALEAFSRAVQQRSSEVIVKVKMPDGQILTRKGLELSYGIGKDKQAAESELKADKQRRLEAGIRTERERNVDAVAKPVAEGGQDRKREVKRKGKRYSLGKLSDITDTPAFKRWFGDSKVVDGNGRPLIVYHGTKADFSEFSDKFSGEGMSGMARDGFFFTSSPRQASGYAGGAAPGGRVMPVFLSITNPVAIEYDIHGIDDIIDGDEAVAKLLSSARSVISKVRGKDGLIVKDVAGIKGNDLYVAFKPTQIKSKFNRGTFSQTDPKINLSLGKSAEQVYSEEYTKQRAAVVTGIKKIIREMAPNVNVEVVDQLFAEGGAVKLSGAKTTARQPVAGVYDPAQNLVQVSLGLGDPQNTAQHEALHALKEMGLLTGREWRLLSNRSAKEWKSKYDVPSTEEGIAYAFGDYRAGKTFTGPIDKLFQRIKTFFERLGNLLRGMGFNTVDDVFGEIKAGNVGKRPAKPESSAESKYSTQREKRIDRLAQDFESIIAVTKTVRWPLQAGGDYNDRLYIHTEKMNGGKNFNGGTGYYGMHVDLKTGRFELGEVAGARTRRALAEYIPKIRGVASQYEESLKAIPYQESVYPPDERQLDETKYRESVVEWAKQKWGETVRARGGAPIWANFVKWFDNSMVVDEAGDPLVVYHGTNADVGVDFKFDRSRLGENYQDKPSEEGFFFAESEDGARQFGANVIPVYLKAENIKDVTPEMASKYTEEWLYDLESINPEEHEFQTTTKQYENSQEINKGVELAIADILPQPNVNAVRAIDENGDNWYVVKNPSRIKSTKNLGAFNPKDPSIKASLGRSNRRYTPEQEDSKDFNIKASLGRGTPRSTVRGIDNASPGAAAKVKKWVRRNFTKEGLLNSEAFERRLEKDSEMNVGEADIAAMVYDLERDVAAAYGVKRYNDVPSDSLEKVTQHLGGKDVSLPEGLGEKVDHLRGYLDRMSGGMLEAMRDMLRIEVSELSTKDSAALTAYMSGKPDGYIPKSMEKHWNLYQTIHTNMGTYLTRSYQAFDDAKWKEKVLKNRDLVSRAEEFIATNNIKHIANKSIGIRAKDRGKKITAAISYLNGAPSSDALSEKQVNKLDSLRGEILNEGEVKGAVREILQSAKKQGNFVSFVAKGSKVGSKDVSILTRRKDVPSVIRELLGEYKDPKINFVRSATKMQYYVANHHFLMSLRRDGLGVFFFKKPTGEYDDQIAGESSEVLNPINGLYTTEDFRQGLEDAVNKFDGSDLMRNIIRINSMVKYGKTILSPTTQARNFMSAAMFSIMNGHFNWTHAVKSYKAAKADLFTKDEEWRAYIKKLIGLGVIHNNPFAGELRDAIKDFTELDIYSKGPHQNLKRFLSFMQRAYQVGDDFWKIIGWENEVVMQRKTGLSMAEAEEKAAYRIRNGYPTYSMVPRAVKQIRRWPLIGTFVSFPYEVVRTSYNQLEFIREDMKDNKREAARRVLGFAIASSAAYAASIASMMVMGIDSDDDEAVRAQLPKWSRNSQLYYIGYDKNGMPVYLDLSYIDPYTYIKKPLSAILSGNNEGVDDKIVDALSELLEPFIGADIAAGALGEIVFNKKMGTGAPIYNPQDSGPKKATKIMNYVRKAVQPGVISNMERTIKAINGDMSRSGKQYNIKDEGLAWIGFRLGTLNVPQSMIYRSYGFSDDKKNATRILSYVAGSGSDVSDSDMRSAVSSMMDSRRQAYKKMIKLVSGAKRLGMDDDSIYDVLRAAKVGKKDVSYLVDGEIPPYIVSRNFINAARDRALATAVSKKKRGEIDEKFDRREDLIYDLVDKANDKNTK